jgi:hypothetical protein
MLAVGSSSFLCFAAASKNDVGSAGQRAWLYARKGGRMKETRRELFQSLSRQGKASHSCHTIHLYVYSNTDKHTT